MIRIVLAIFIVVLAGSAAFWFFWSNQEAPRPEPVQAEQRRRSISDMEFESKAPGIGSGFPDLTLYDAQGNDFSTAQLKGSPTVLIFGCLTCPPFFEKIRRIEAVAKDYKSKGVKFFFVYKALSHPLSGGVVTPYTKAERLMHVSQIQKVCGDKIPWLCDTMNDVARRTLGGDNSEIILDENGVIVRKRFWCDPDDLRKDLEQLVGTVAEISVPEGDSPDPLMMAEIAPIDLVPAIRLKGQYRPIQIGPVLESEENPFYVKLHAEAQPSLLERGEGNLYLMFNLDPVYFVHWNNLIEPLQVEITCKSDGNIKHVLNAPKLNHPKDADPRDFLLYLKFEKGKPAPLDLTVRYFACQDAEGWCRSVTPKYRVHFRVDYSEGELYRSEQRTPRFLAVLDINRDGQLTPEELSNLPRVFEDLDVTRNGALDQMELTGQSP